MQTKKNSNKKQFRLRGKKLFLIYPNLNLNINSIENIEELILNQFKNKLPKIVQYIIAIEKDKNNLISYQIFLEFNQKVELYGKNCLDLTFNSISFKGKYETIKKKDIAIRTITKNKNFIANPELNVLDGEIYLNFKEYLIELNKRGAIATIKNYLNKK